MKAKDKRRLALIASLVVVVGAIAYLVQESFSESLVYFHTPTEVLQKSAELGGRKIRLAGQVQLGSLVRKPGSLAMSFKITDGTVAVPVVYQGIVPDLFAEGQMAVAEGRYGDGLFKADLIMAKHSEDYDPKQMNYRHVKDVRPEKW